MKRKFYLLIVALIAALPLTLTSCGSDDEPDGGSGSDLVYEDNGPLVINDIEWPITLSAPNFDDYSFVYWSTPKGSSDQYILQWRENLENVSVGDDVSTDLYFPQQDCLYSYTAGTIEVVKIGKESVTLKFHEVSYEYSGPEMGFSIAKRDKKYLPDHLTVSGTVRFIHNQPVVKDED